MAKKILLNRNEVIQGPSPEVKRTLKNFDAREASFYFEGYGGSSLRPVLAKQFGIPPQQISIGYGVEFFLRSVIDGLDPKHDTILMQEHHFTQYDAYAATKGVKIATFHMTTAGMRFVFDIEDCVKKIHSVKPKVILLTSPNNPTGNCLSPAELAKILRAADKKTLVVLDEVYYGFNEKYDEHAFIALLKKYPNFAILRSFSKIYALAGARIAYALWGRHAKELIRYADSTLGGSRVLEALAIAALNSPSYYRSLKKKIIADRKFFIEKANKMKLFKAYDSHANFVAVKMDTKVVIPLEREMNRSNVLIAKFVAPQLLRVSIGLRKNTARFLAQMQKVERNVLAKRA